MAEAFDLEAKSKELAPKAFELWEKVLEKSLTNLSAGGYDVQLLRYAMMAAEKIMAYGHGQPTSKFELFGKDGQPIKHSLDVAGLSTDTLKELLAHRRKPE